MVYIKLLKPRKGILPSEASNFNYLALTATQKLKLAQCRIFQTFINSGYNQGVSKLKKDLKKDPKDLSDIHLYP